jgi:hypothetical protein
LQTIQTTLVETKRYGLVWFMRALFLLFAASGLVSGGYLIDLAITRITQNSWMEGLGGLAAIVLGLYIGAGAFQYFVQLSQDAVSTGGPLKTQTIRLQDVLGKRIVSDRNGSYLVIESRNKGDKRLMISNYYKTDEAWSDWASSLVDLDEQDKKAVLEAIAGSEELGATPEARLSALKKAKTISITLSGLAIVTAGGLWLFRSFMSPPVFGALDFILVILPWIALWLVARQPLLYNPFAVQKDPRPTLLIVFLLNGFALMVDLSDNLQIEDFGRLLGYACLPALLMGVVFYSATAKSITGGSPSFRFS